jgi:hypothetical protein
MTFYPVGASHWLRDGSISREENERCSWSVRFFPIFARFELLTEKQKKLISKFQEKVAEREKKKPKPFDFKKKKLQSKRQRVSFCEKKKQLFFFFL